MRRLIALLLLSVTLACSDTSISSPEVDQPQFAAGLFSRGDVASVKSRYGPPEMSESHTDTENTISLCSPSIPVSLRITRDVLTHTWQGYDAEAGISAGFRATHLTGYREYTNLANGRSISGHQGYQFDVYWRISDGLDVNERTSWQSGNVLMLTSPGEGRVRYKAGHQVATTDWSSGTPVTEFEFVGTQELDGLCDFLRGNS